MPLHVLSTRAHRQEAKIVLYSLWYHHTETSEWSKVTKITKILDHSFRCDDTRGWPPDDEHLCSKRRGMK